MSTKATIAVTVKGKMTRFKGVQHHNAGQPERLGVELRKLYSTVFRRDLELMVKTLIYDHPAGWSNIIGRDWSKPAQWIEPNGNTYHDGPVCYCHGQRHEKPHPVTHLSHTDSEYLYLFDVESRKLHILRHDGYHRGRDLWVFVDIVDLDNEVK